MARASDILSIAEKEIGYIEGKNNDTKYGKAYGMNNVYWCMIFVWWVFQQIDKSLFFDGGKCASCTQLMNWAKSKGQFVTKDFKAGDILLYNWKCLKTSCDHTGIFVGYKNSSTAYAIEGNTSKGSGGSQSNGDGVYKRERALKYVVGAFRPQYEKSYRELLQARSGLANATMDYLAKYKYADDLFKKLYEMK